MTEMPDRPSVVLQGFHGGIVGSADIALRLAQILLQNLVGKARLASCLPLQAHDRGDRWSITGADGEEADACRIDIRKRDAAIAALGIERCPEVLGDPATVEKFAAVLAESAGGPAEPNRQMPFSVANHGATWLVRGSANADRMVEGPGPFRLEVQKRDARVLDMVFEGIIHTPPEVKELLRGNKRRRAPQV